MLAATLDEFERDPVGRYVGGETFVHFCATPSLWGILLWGRPSTADARQLGRSLVLELRPPATSHASLIDASRLDSADPAAFALLERYLSHHADLLRTHVQRVALVRPGGLGGAIVAGAYEVLPRPYPVTVFYEARAAVEWLDANAGVPDGFLGQIEELYATVARTPAYLRALRVLLDKRLDGITVGDAAGTLGMSERTLQRKLGEAETTFQDEMAGARVRAAQRMLLDDNAPLTTIALEVGCASLQHFSALFRKRTGQSPSAWRQRRRAPRGR